MQPHERHEARGFGTAVKSVLVAYSTYAGSTAEVASAISEELARRGLRVETQRMSEVDSFDGYDAVVVGGPMILGWHRPARAFLRRHRRALSQVPFAVFVTAMSLTDTGTTDVDGVAVTVDDKLAKHPAKQGSLTFKERYARLGNYMRPILRASRPARPACLAIFAGRLEYGRLPWYGVLFVMTILQAPAGDRRNWPAIRAWASELPARLGLT